MTKTMSPEELTEEIQSLVHDYRAKLDELDKRGLSEEDPLFKDFEEKINGKIDELRKEQEAFIAKSQRPPTGTAGTCKSDPAELQKKHEAFAKYLVAASMGDKSGLSKDEKALVEDATGQILVPEDFEETLQRRVPEINVMRGFASQRTTNRDRVRRATVAGLTASFGKLETGDDIGDGESTLTPTEDTIYVEDQFALTKVGEDELEDAAFELGSVLEEEAAIAFAELEEAKSITGAGHGSKELEGLRNGSTITRVETASSGALDADDVIDLRYAVPRKFRSNGVYLAASGIEQAIRKLKDSVDGQYLWQPSLQAGAPSSFDGHRFVVQDDLDGTVSAGNEVMLFGDIRLGYRFVDRRGIRVQVLRELYSEAGLVGWKFTRRVGGGIIRADAMRILKIMA